MKKEESMSRRYGHTIPVICGPGGEPERLTWRGATYHVTEVLGSWHLRDRWWQPAQPALGAANSAAAEHGSAPYLTSAQGASDRTYYRLRCREGLLCEVYRDAAANRWVLDRVHD